VGHTLESCTSEIKIVKLSVPELDDGDVVFVDTPGFDDTHKSDADILKMVADWLKSTYVS
jgi:predicted GTPase